MVRGRISDILLRNSSTANIIFMRFGLQRNYFILGENNYAYSSESKIRFGNAEYLAALHSTTCFAESRIIYGVTDINSSPKPPYPAHRRAAFAEVSLFSVRCLGLRSNTVKRSVRGLVYRSSVFSRSFGAQARQLFRTGSSSASRLFNF